MKIRNGFVSNSSSSSFLVSFSPETDIRNIFAGSKHVSSRATCIGLNNVIEKLKDWFICDYLEDYKTAKFLKLCGKIVKADWNNRGIALLEVEHYDEMAYDILNHHDDIKILENFDA